MLDPVVRNKIVRPSSAASLVLELSPDSLPRPQQMTKSTDDLCQHIPKVRRSSRSSCSPSLRASS